MHSLGIVQWNSTRRDHPGYPRRVSGTGPVNTPSLAIHLISLAIHLLLQYNCNTIFFLQPSLLQYNYKVAIQIFFFHKTIGQ